MTRALLPTVFSPVVLLLASLGGATAPALAAQGEASCTGFIDSVPVVIQAQGTWCLRKDLNTAQSVGHAIDIRANNVVLDCNHFKLGGLAAGVGTETIGIYSQNLHNVSVRRCNVRGFRIGLAFTGNGGSAHLVEDNRFEGNTHAGLRVIGEGSIVRRNRVLDTGGSTAPQSADAIGISLWLGVDAVDNTIGNVVARAGRGGNAHGIDSMNNHQVNIADNRIRGVIAAEPGQAIAIFHSALGRSMLRNNDLTGTGAGTGLSCGHQWDHARGNLINGFATPITGCSDDGNFSKP